MKSRRAFTLVEVLATLMLMAIVLPSVMKGITLATAAADMARHRTEAAGLAQSELAQILASQSWTNGEQTGNFAPDWPDYSWATTVSTWAGDSTGAGLQEIDLKVTWAYRSRQESVTLSALAYQRAQTQ
jgi:prepilin-type N-terminal cleavage/methylation domain-containing protein